MKTNKKMGTDYNLSIELKKALKEEIENNLGTEIKNIREENKRLLERNLHLLKLVRRLRDKIQP